MQHHTAVLKTQPNIALGADETPKKQLYCHNLWACAGKTGEVLAQKLAGWAFGQSCHMAQSSDAAQRGILKLRAPDAACAAAQWQ
jgi:hypothetical protein